MAEGARLESVYTFTGIGGSNPSLSASSFVLLYLTRCDTVSDTLYHRVPRFDPPLKRKQNKKWDTHFCFAHNS